MRQHANFSDTVATAFVLERDQLSRHLQKLTHLTQYSDHGPCFYYSLSFRVQFFHQWMPHNDTTQNF